MSKTIYIIFVVFSILTIGCGEKEKEYPSNIVVLLDISDRISDKEYPVSGSTDRKNDTSNCKFIMDNLRKILDAEGYDEFEQRLQFIVVNQPKFQFKTRYSNNEMAFNKRLIETYDKFDKIAGDIFQTLTDLYSEASYYDKSTLTGSDIWEWFKESSKSYILPEYKNYIICMTDGYLDFNNDVKRIRPPGTYIKLDEKIRRADNWRELLKTDEYKLKTPEGVDFGDYKYEVQFLIVGIKDRTQEDRTQEDRTQEPTENSDDMIGKKSVPPKVIIADKDILRGMWTIWLESMGIKPYGFVSADVNQQEQIIKFLSSIAKRKAVERVEVSDAADD